MKPSIPKGTRDFSPQEMVKRNYIFNAIREVYQLHGYQPIETPAMENMETLMGKYGEEGDRLIFKILNSGDYFGEFLKKDGADQILSDFVNKNKAFDPGVLKGGDAFSGIEEFNKKTITNSITEKALRYDLTVPFARYVVQHRNDITFPFKRYQIQPVWRADRPQKGRYREFYQCDADVIGSDSLLNEVELIQIIDEVFTKLGVPVIIKLNNRKILQGIAEYLGRADKMIDIAVAIDKIDKAKIEVIIDELEQKGFTSDEIHKLIIFLQINEPASEWIKEGVTQLEDSFAMLAERIFKIPKEYITQPNIEKGINELRKILMNIGKCNLELLNGIKFEPSLARGLNYYTGTIIEVKVDTSKCASQFTSSICGGGRYDDLTGIFGLPDVSGVGISFGADRIYDVMEELNLFPTDVSISTKVLLINFGEKEAQYCLKVLRDLHAAGISAELYPDAKKLNKQFEYADKRNIPYVISIGQSEMEQGVAKIKNMASGEQKEVSVNELKAHIA